MPVDGVAKARVSNARSISRQDTLEVVEGDLDHQIEKFKNSTDNEEKIKLTRCVVESRNNHYILELLKCTNIGVVWPEERVESSGVDTESGRNNDSSAEIRNREDTEEETVDLGNPEYDYSVFETAVELATLNDDPETLKAILDWGCSNIRWEKEIIQKRLEQSDSNLSPILISSLENYSRCLPLLYNAGYRIILPQVDHDRIKKMLKLDHHLASSLRFYYAVNKGSRINEYIKIGKRNLDPVEQYLVFRGHTNPLYLSMSFISREKKLFKEAQTHTKGQENKLFMVDPIRRSFCLSYYMAHLGNNFPEHMEEYEKIRIQCQDFARKLLELCNNTAEVNTLLEWNPTGSLSENTNWHLAIWEGHKTFVAHPYFQHYTWGKIIGDGFEWGNYFFIGKILMLPYAVLLFFFYPYVVVFDSLFRDSNILFVSPEEFGSKKSRETDSRAASITMEDGEAKNNPSNTESNVMAFFRGNIHRPIYRMFVSGFLELTFLLSLFFTLKDPDDKPHVTDLLWYDLVTWYFIATYLIEDLLNIRRWNWNFFISFWNIYSLINHLLLITGGSIALYGYFEIDGRRTYVGGNHPINIGMTLVSYGASMSFFRAVRWLLFHRNIGPVLLCILRVMEDVIYICIIAIIAYVAFAVGLYSMYKPFTPMNVNDTMSKYVITDEKLTNNSGWRGILSIMFWRVFDGEFSDAEVVHKDGIDGKSFSLEFSHLMGLAMWAMYQGLTVILLINILIALMNSTYMKVWENADMEWKYSKSFYQIQFLHPRAVFPPPFRWIYYFAKMMRKIKNQECDNYDSKNQEGKIVKYLKLLLRLVKTRIQIDKEESTEENFNDLRKDIKNMVNPKGKGLCRKCKSEID